MLRFARYAVAVETDLARPLCSNEIESEIRVMISCPQCSDPRGEYIRRRYVSCPSHLKLSMLLAYENKYLQL